MKKITYILLCVVLVACLFSGCGLVTEADKVNSNLSKQADYFECERRITVYNARTDTVIFEAEGYMSLSNNYSTDELVVTFKVGPDSFKKNYIYLNDYTLYTVEDITGTHTDPYHYKWIVNYDVIPDVEFRP